MSHLRMDDAEYMADEYEMEDIDDDMQEDFRDRDGGSDSDNDEYDFMDNKRADTTAAQARSGRDIQGIPWERLSVTREKYRETRIEQYKNYENVPNSGQVSEKFFCFATASNKIRRFYEKSRTMKLSVKFQRRAIALKLSLHLLLPELSQIGVIFRFQRAFLPYSSASCTVALLRNLVWATSKHDVYLISNSCIIHWSALSRSKSEVLNVSGHVAPTEKHPGSLLEGFSQTQVSTLAVKDNLLVAGGFHGELICKNLDRPGVSFCTRTTYDDNAITNAIEIYSSSSGATHFTASNNDCGIRDFDMEKFQLTNHFQYPWPVNVEIAQRWRGIGGGGHGGRAVVPPLVVVPVEGYGNGVGHTSLSPDGRMLVIVGDHADGLLVDSRNGKTITPLVGHKDFSFATAWSPDGINFATGNQDRTCRIWDVRNLSKSLAVLKGNLGAIRSIRYSSDGRFMAMAEPADFVHVFDVNNGYNEEQEIDFFGEISGLSFSPDTESLFIGVWDRTYGSLLEYNRRRNYSYLDSLV
ncbi:hypothetical protein KSS87_019019 [Heliosperma pusillum]|nr:hypothetical protein KSS87_019019 [Heliosperma pusillum]